MSVSQISYRPPEEFSDGLQELRDSTKTSCMSYSPGARHTIRRAAANPPRATMPRSIAKCARVTISLAAANITLCSPRMPPPCNTAKAISPICRAPVIPSRPLLNGPEGHASTFRSGFPKHQRRAGRCVDLPVMMDLQDFDIPTPGRQGAGGLGDQVYLHVHANGKVA